MNSTYSVVIVVLCYDCGTIVLRALAESFIPSEQGSDNGGDQEGDNPVPNHNGMSAVRSWDI